MHIMHFNMHNMHNVHNMDYNLVLLHIHLIDLLCIPLSSVHSLIGVNPTSSCNSLERSVLSNFDSITFIYINASHTHS